MGSELIIVIIGSLILGVLIGGAISPKSNSSVKSIESKIDAIIEHLGVDFNPYRNVPDDVMAALKNGERIKAIKLYREFSGTSLKEASDAIAYIETSIEPAV